MKGNKLVIAVILALIVCLVLIPTCAFAEGEGEGGDSVTPVVEQEGQQPEQPTTPPVPPTEEEANPSDNDEGKNLPKSGDKEVTEQSASGENEPKDDSSESSGDVKDEAKPEGDKTPGEENVPLQPSESKYTVEFTAGEKQYVLNGDTSVALDEILGELGISGTVTEASSSNDSLFSVAADENGKWTVSANNAFSTTHSLTVVVDGQTYEIVVTDDNVCVVKNGTSEAEYGKLQEAIDKANDGDTIVLKDKVTESVTIAAGKTITIDLNGKTLTNETGKHTIINNGTLTIIDSVGTGVVDNVSHGKAALVNVGTAILNGGNFTRSAEAGATHDDNGGNSYYNIKNLGTMTINDGVEVWQENGHFSSLIANGWFNYKDNGASDLGVAWTSGKTAKLTINGGTFSGGKYTVKNDDYGYVTIENGKFSNIDDGVVLNTNVAEIKGGTFTGTPNVGMIYNWKASSNGANEGSLVVNGGTFNNEKLISVNAGGTIAVTSGIYDDSSVTKYVKENDVAILSSNGKTAIASSENDESIAAIIAEAVKSGEPLVIENLPDDVSVSAPEGVTIINKSNSTLTINGVEVKPGESYTVPTTAAPASTPLSAKYFVLEGKAQQWTDGDLEFVLNSNAVVKVLIDGVEVEFTVAEDGTVTIASAVIEALDAGTHEIEFVFADGSCTTTFTK